MMRSKLFVPASRPELFDKAMASDADGISFDLEDAVHESRKAEARATLSRYLEDSPLVRNGKLVVVRINDVSSPHFLADLEAVVCPAVHKITIPKLESAEAVRTVVTALSRLETKRGIKQPITLLATIESPLGLRLAHEIAAADPRVVGLGAGLVDLLEPLGIDRSDTVALRQVLLQVRLAAGEAGIDAYDGAFANVADTEGYKRECEIGRRLGFAGKTCIHPSQIAMANATFRPSDGEIAHAVKVVEAAKRMSAGGTGAFVVDGRMIDLPLIKRAEALVAQAKGLGLLPKAAGGAALTGV